MKKLYFALFSVLIFATYSCKEQTPYSTLSGFAQGTTYSIIYQGTENYGEEIKELLKAFDKSLSLYDKESLICAINAGATDSVDSWITKSFEISSEVNIQSGGLFDPTLAPLIAAYGFARKEQREELDSIEFQNIMKLVGLNKVQIQDGRLLRQSDSIQLDFNGIAQGLSVDLVSELLENKGVNNYMVEIGGEIFTRGISPSNKEWRIGIDTPKDGNLISGAEIATVIELKERGLATSGNYRKFIDKPSGERITHTIDPRSGKSTHHNLLSATIIARNAGYADALATACMVGGLEWSKKFIEQLKKSQSVDCYLIYATPNGEMESFTTIDKLKK